jgi:pyrroline-5-carboxylate reductase
MASALIGGLLQKGYATDALSVVEVDAASRNRLSALYGVKVAEQPGLETANSDLLVLAVKPQQLPAVATGIRALMSRQVVLSVAAGVRLASLSKWLGGYARVIRVMPNTPALVLAGVSALYADPLVSPAERDSAESVMRAVGETLWVEREDLLDAVTAVSGSGPAYVYYFMEALQEAAQALGLDGEAARHLTLHTFLGAAKLAQSSAEDAATLRARVTSKGGTTERALTVLESQSVKAALIDAVRQAATRSRELGEQAEKGT